MRYLNVTLLAGLMLGLNTPVWAADEADINGRWQRYGVGANAANMAAGEETYTPPPRPEPPLRPEYMEIWQADQKRRADAAAAGTPIATPWNDCIGSGYPGMMAGAFPMEILQSTGQVTVIQEAFTEIHRIYLDEEQLTLDDIELGFYGHTVGHWDDGVLYAETIGIKDYVQVNQVPHSPEMRVETKYWMVTDDIMWVEIRMIDPVYLTEPWVWTYAYQKMSDYQMQEYVCEGNREYTDDEGYQRIRVHGE